MKIMEIMDIMGSHLDTEDGFLEDGFLEDGFLDDGFPGRRNLNKSREILSFWKLSYRARSCRVPSSRRRLLETRIPETLMMCPHLPS